MSRLSQMEVPVIETVAVPAPVATATESGDDRMGLIPLIHVSTVLTHGGAISKVSGTKRSKYNGVYHLIFKNMRAGNISFFTFSELSGIISEFEKYTQYVKKFNETKLSNERKRIYDNVMSRTDSDVQRLINASLQYNVIHSIRITQIVPLSFDSLLEQKNLMYRNIAHILAKKARNIVCNHKGFKDTFRYKSSDEQHLEQYFIERTMREIDYFEFRNIILTLYDRTYSFNYCNCNESDSESDSESECEWCGNYCNNHCSGARKYERRQEEFDDDDY